jgi:exodeoxyribonuclease VII small subunit
MSKTKQSAAAKNAAPDRSARKPDSADAEDESLSFEVAHEQLENTVGQLEEGEMPLEDALELFETGVKLSRQCTATLSAAEKRIEILVADREGGEGSVPAPFETDEFEDDEAFDVD